MISACYGDDTLTANAADEHDACYFHKQCCGVMMSREESRCFVAGNVCRRPLSSLRSPASDCIVPPDENRDREPSGRQELTIEKNWKVPGLQNSTHTCKSMRTEPRPW